MTVAMAVIASIESLNGWLGQGLAPRSVGSASCCSPFPLGVPHYPNREPVSSARGLKPIVPISGNALTCFASASRSPGKFDRQTALGTRRLPCNMGHSVFHHPGRISILSRWRQPTSPHFRSRGRTVGGAPRFHNHDSGGPGNCDAQMRRGRGR
jgi:hypothetical protein